MAFDRESQLGQLGGQFRVVHGHCFGPALPHHVLVADRHDPPVLPLGHHQQDVRVQLWIWWHLQARGFCRLAARVMCKRHRHDALGLLGPLAPAKDHVEALLDVGQHRRHGFVLGRLHLAPQLGVSNCPEHRHRLGRRRRHVDSGHPVGLPPTHALSRERVAAVEEVEKLLVCC